MRHINKISKCQNVINSFRVRMIISKYTTIIFNMLLHTNSTTDCCNIYITNLHDFYISVNRSILMSIWLNSNKSNHVFNVSNERYYIIYPLFWKMTMYSLVDWYLCATRCVTSQKIIILVLAAVNPSSLMGI